MHHVFDFDIDIAVCQKISEREFSLLALEALRLKYVL
jgi:hypothetical protein